MSKSMRRAKAAVSIAAAPPESSRPAFTAPKPIKIVTVDNGREVKDHDEAEMIRARAVARLDANAAASRVRRCPDAPERASVRRAALAVERAIVEAEWTLVRLPDAEAGFMSPGRCGVDYVQDRNDRFANAVANDGKWDERSPRPAPPSGNAIDAMFEPLTWLSWLEPNLAKLLSIAAATKRGDVERNVSWRRVRASLPQLGGLSIRMMQRRYDEALRIICDRLTRMS